MSQKFLNVMEMYLSHAESVLLLMNKAGVASKLKKYLLRLRSIDGLDHVKILRQSNTAQKTLSGVRNLMYSTTTFRLCSFWVLCNTYYQWVPKGLQMTAFLNEKIQKGKLTAKS